MSKKCLKNVQKMFQKCPQNAPPLGCDFPIVTLHKLQWPELAEMASDAFNFVLRFELNTEDSSLAFGNFSFGFWA